MTFKIDPYSGMTLTQFATMCEKYNLTLDESRLHELKYYFVLWNDTLRHNAKTGAEPCFDSFMGAVARGDC